MHNIIPELNKFYDLFYTKIKQYDIKKEVTIENKLLLDHCTDTILYSAKYKDKPCFIKCFKIPHKTNDIKHNINYFIDYSGLLYEALIYDYLLSRTDNDNFYIKPIFLCRNTGLEDNKDLYAYIVLEKINKCADIKILLIRLLNLISSEDNIIYYTLFNNLIYQMCNCIYKLYNYGITHHDPHLGNFILECKINNNTVNFNVKIFDYDNSYFNNIGINYKSKNLDKLYNFCYVNTLSNSLLQFFNYLLKEIPNEYKPTLQKTCIDIFGHDTFTKCYTEETHSPNKVNGPVVWPKTCNCQSVSDIKLNSQKNPDIKIKDIHVINTISNIIKLNQESTNESGNESYNESGNESDNESGNESDNESEYESPTIECFDSDYLLEMWKTIYNNIIGNKYIKYKKKYIKLHNKLK